MIAIERHRPGLLARLIALHALAVRQHVASPRGPLASLENLALQKAVHFSLAGIFNLEILKATSLLGARVLRAVLRSGTFQAHAQFMARLCRELTDLRADAVADIKNAGFLLQETAALLAYTCQGLFPELNWDLGLIGDQQQSPPQPQSQPPPAQQQQPQETPAAEELLALRREWLQALVDSNVLEHAIRAAVLLRRGVEAATARPGNRNKNTVTTSMARGYVLKAHVALWVCLSFGFYLLDLEPALRALDAPWPRPTCTEAVRRRAACNGVDSSDGREDDGSGTSTTGGAAVDGLDLIPLMRTLAAGPGVQFFLGREVVLFRSLLEGVVAPSYGLSAVDTMSPLTMTFGDQATDLGDPRGQPVSLRVDVMACLSRAAVLWQLTISGQRPPDVAQPRAGWAAPAHPDWAALPLPVQPGNPYHTVNVYDMLYGTFEAYVSAYGIDVDGGAVTMRAFLPPAQLAMRLVMELPPRQARERLPGLWRTVAAVLPAARCSAEAAFSFLGTVSDLLRLQVDPEPNMNPGTGGAEGDGGLAFSLRCALQGGLVPALEELLRRAAGQATGQKDGPSVCLFAVNALLRWSGIWPAILTDGSGDKALSPQVVSLLVTLAKLTRALRGRNAGGPVYAAGSCARVVVEVVSPSEALGAAAEAPPTSAEALWLSYMAALLEQSVAVARLLPPRMFLDTVASAGRGVRAGGCSGGGGGSSGGRDGGQDGEEVGVERGAPWTASGRTGSGWEAELVFAPLALNAALEPHSPPLSFPWVRASGGLPTRGSPACFRQQSTALLAAVRLVPDLTAALRQPCMLRLAWAPELYGVVLRWAMAATLHCSLALWRCHDGTRDEEAAPASSAEETYEAWRSCLVDTFHLLEWLGPVLREDVFGEGRFAGLQPAVADLEAVLAAVLAPDSTLAGLYRPAADAASAAAAAAAAAGAAPEEVAAARDTNGVGSAPLGDGDRAALLAALRCFGKSYVAVAPASAAAADSAAAIGSAEISGVAADGAGGGLTPAAAAYLRSFGAFAAVLEGMHDEYDGAAASPPTELPSPRAVELGVAGLVPRCANPACACLDGPSEAAVKLKPCGRCRTVSYCGRACQVQHWRAGHQEDCQGAAARGEQRR